MALKVEPIAISAIEVLIDAYRKVVESLVPLGRGEIRPILPGEDKALNAAWEALCTLWTTAEIPDEPDTEGGLFRLCYRLVYAMHSVGFDPDDEENEDLLEAAAINVYDFLPADRDIIDRGEDGRMDDGSFLTVDVVQGKVIVSDVPVKPEWSEPIRRTEAKVKRNDPCPCGSGKKHKKCGLAGGCA